MADKQVDATDAHSTEWHFFNKYRRWTSLSTSWYHYSGPDRQAANEEDFEEIRPDRDYFPQGLYDDPERYLWDLTRGEKLRSCTTIGRCLDEEMRVLYAKRKDLGTILPLAEIEHTHNEARITTRIELKEKVSLLKSMIEEESNPRWKWRKGLENQVHLWKSIRNLSNDEWYEISDTKDSGDGSHLDGDNDEEQMRILDGNSSPEPNEVSNRNFGKNSNGAVA